MHKEGGWFRRLFANIRKGLRIFMQGRYGSDKLNTALLILGIGFCVIAMIFGTNIPGLVFTLLSYALMGIVIFRMLSRNTYKRYQENRKYLTFLQRIKDREHRYFTCPRCKQSVSCGKNKIKAKILPVGYGAVFGADVFFGFSPLAFLWMGWYTKGKI
jgi:hypothetical protein